MAPFDAEQLAEITARAKRQIRKRMRTVRSAHPPRALAEKSARIVSRLLELDEVLEARSLALFFPLLERGEVDLRALDAALRGQNKRLYYPFQEPKRVSPDESTVTFRTGFRLTNSIEELVDRGQRFAEPDPSAPEATSGDVDLVLVPALAVGADGHRIGYGAGYYDATLPDVCPPARSVIVAYDFQLLAEVPFEPHDRPCDLIVTDTRVHRPGAPAR